MKKAAFFSLFTAACATFLSIGSAYADVVGPPPDSCINGGIPSTCHGGPFCALDSCTTDADCEGGKVCKETPLCTGTIDCGGGGGPSPTTQVAGSCDAGCQSGSACTKQLVCVASSTGTGGGGSGGDGAGGTGDDLVVTGCACQVVGTKTAVGMGGGLFFLVAAAALRSRRKSRKIWSQIKR